MISNDRRMPSSADLRGKTESTARGEQPVEGNSNESVMVREKNEHLKASVRI